MRFGLTVQEEMERLGISQTELSAMSGLPRPYLANLLSGVSKEPTWPKAVAIIRALGMTPDQFAARQGGKECKGYRMSANERAIVDAYRSMTSEGRKAASAAIGGLASVYGRKRDGE